MRRYFKILLSIGLLAVLPLPTIAQTEPTILDQNLFPHDEPPIELLDPAASPASSTPASSTPASSTPASSAPASSAPASSTPETASPATSAPEPTTSASSTPEANSGMRLQIDLSSRRLTLYQGEMELSHFPIAVGREGWQTPIGEWEVREMIHDPAWRNPFTGRVIPGGDPNNPLGDHWIGFWTDGEQWIGMHGTPNPESVGRAASHGCIRLYNHDIAALFALVTVGTPVVVVP